jgi:hypothetical protein
MSEDPLRFRCYQCNQLLGVSFRRAGTVIACPKCGAELKVPRPDEQAATVEATQASPGLPPQSRLPATPTAPTSKSASTTLPSFMEEIAAAIPDDLATLRPEDIRVEAEFVDLVVTTSDRIVPSVQPAVESPPVELADEPDAVEAYTPKTPPPAEVPPITPVEQGAVDAATVGELSAIKIETPTLRPPGRQLQSAPEVILQPATVLAWSLLVLLSLPMAFLAGLLIGHFVWR